MLLSLMWRLRPSARPWRGAAARARGSLMPHAQVAIVPGSHGGFNRINELNQQIAAFIKAQATGNPADQQAHPAGT